MLVLLIIFMVAAPMMTQGMAVNLPQARRSTPLTAQALYVTIPASFGQTHKVQIDNDVVHIDILAERIRQAMLQRSDKSLFIRSDGAVTMQEFITVSDKLREGGVEMIGVSTQPVRR
jgi:biopolymer transport protein ExbD